jgi:hypothetical protein
MVDIAVVCESWLKPKHTSHLFTVQDFRLFRCDRIDRIGGGVCVWVRSHLKCEVCRFSRTRLVNPLFEFIWLYVKCNDSTDLVNCAFYNHPKLKHHASELSTVLVDDLEEISFLNLGFAVVITGGLNSLNTDRFIYDCGLSFINNDYTHGKRILHKCLVSRPGLYVCRTVQSNIKIKHKALIIYDCHLPFTHPPKEAKVHRFCYDIGQPFLQTPRYELGAYNWRPLLQETNVQALYDDFVKVIHWYEYIPNKSVIISRSVSRFISHLVQLMLRRRNRLMRRGQFLLADELSNKIGHLSAAEKSEFLSAVNSHNTKELWSAVEMLVAVVKTKAFQI